MKTDRADQAAVGAAVPAVIPATTVAAIAPAAVPLPEALVQTPAPSNASPLHPRDEFTGLGGDYVRDPVTGMRTRVDPLAPPALPFA